MPTATVSRRIVIVLHADPLHGAHNVKHRFLDQPVRGGAGNFKLLRNRRRGQASENAHLVSAARSLRKPTQCREDDPSFIVTDQFVFGGSCQRARVAGKRISRVAPLLSCVAPVQSRAMLRTIRYR